MGRQYRHKTEGYRVPSVTTVIPDAYEGAPKDNLQEGQKRGNFIHKASVLIDQDNLDWKSVPPAWRGYLFGYMKAVEELGLTYIKGWSEVAYLSKVYGFGGTPDRVALIDRRLTPTVIDLKSGESAPLKLIAIWGVQAAGYEILYREVTGHKGRVDRIVIQVHKNGKYDPYPLEDASDRAAFLAMCAAHKWKMAKGLV